MDKLRCMEVFVSIVEAGNFSAAAEKLDISSVMVGKHVRQLEDHLGTRLLHRTTRRQRLTEAGAAFYDDCRKVLEQVRQAETSVQALYVVPQGVLRVSAPVTLGAFVIAPLVADYLALYPQMKVELELSNRFVDLIDGGYDAAIRIGPTGDADLVARPLSAYRMVICASPDYLRKHGVPASPAELARHRCLVNLVWNRRSAWHLQDATGDVTWPSTGVFASNDGQALRAAALKGAGLLLQPEVLMADDIAHGRLIAVLEDFLPPPRPVHLLYLPDRRPRPKIKSFVEYMEKHLPADAGEPRTASGSRPRRRATR